MKMVAGALHPGEEAYLLPSVKHRNLRITGKPVSNLYFSMWSHVCLEPRVMRVLGCGADTISKGCNL